LFPAAAALLVLIAVLAIFNMGAINRQLHSWKVLPEPERLTELYYENHTKLPIAYTPDAAQSFAFTVHNLEYATTDYMYQVTQSSEDGTQTKELANGSFTLAQNLYHTQQITIAPVDLGPRSKVETVIAHQKPSQVAADKNGNRQTALESESIHYWVNKK
jgi:hypothetical protein